MPNKSRRNNQARANQVSAHQKKMVEQRRSRVAKMGREISAALPFRANNRKRG